MASSEKTILFLKKLTHRLQSTLGLLQATEPEELDVSADIRELLLEAIKRIEAVVDECTETYHRKQEELSRRETVLPSRQGSSSV